MKHVPLSDELRNKLIESSNWARMGLDVTLNEAKSSKEDKPSKEKKKRSRKEDDEEDHSEQVEENLENYEDYEELEEEAHVCPLCVSQLDEAVDEERIYEHLNVILGLVDRLSKLEEGSEDIESVIEEAVKELLLQTDEDDEDE